MADLPQVLVAGTATGEVLRLDEPLSFWGGVDPATGQITDLRHPQAGQAVAGRILVMPFGRGSSGGSSVIAEGIRMKTAPLAVLLLEPDEIIALGSIVADELYGEPMPVVVLDEEEHAGLRTGDWVTVGHDGSVERQ
ncbi:MAG: DUF126 domain-containing protein [Actinomycetota bacterium]|nr:DUF126 domain-containing protein [Actinomycetota bacterium]